MTVISANVGFLARSACLFLLRCCMPMMHPSSFDCASPGVGGRGETEHRFRSGCDVILALSGSALVDIRRAMLDGKEAILRVTICSWSRCFDTTALSLSCVDGLHQRQIILNCTRTSGLLRISSSHSHHCLRRSSREVPCVLYSLVNRRLVNRFGGGG